MFPPEVKKGFPADPLPGHGAGIEVLPLGQIAVNPHALAFDDLIDLFRRVVRRGPDHNPPVPLDDDVGGFALASGEKLSPRSGTLGVPDHAAPFFRAFAATQAFHQFVGGPELLVAADHLDAWSVLGIHEDQAGPHDLQQVAFVEHSANELLLLAQSLSGVVGLGPLRFSGIEMLLAGGDGAVVGLDAAGANEEEIAVKEARLALAVALAGGVLAAVQVHPPEL